MTEPAAAASTQANISGPSRHGLGILLVLISTIAWGSGGLFVRLLPYDPWTIVFWRGVFGTLFIGSYVFWRFGRSTWSTIHAMGPAGLFITACSAGTITLMVPAFQNTSVANAMTIYASLPFITAAVAWVWLGERPSASTMIASLAALCGIFIMLGPSSGGPRPGDFLAFLATLSMALMTVAIRRIRHIETLPVAGLATLLTIFISFPLAQHLFDLSPRDYLVAAGFGFVPMTLGMMIFVIGSALIPAALAALISTLETPIGALWAWVGVGEVPAATTFIGGAIVLVSVFGNLLHDRYRSSAMIPP